MSGDDEKPNTSETELEIYLPENVPPYRLYKQSRPVQFDKIPRCDCEKANGVKCSEHVSCRGHVYLLVEWHRQAKPPSTTGDI